MQEMQYKWLAVKKLTFVSFVKPLCTLWLDFFNAKTQSWERNKRNKSG